MTIILRRPWTRQPQFALRPAARYRGALTLLLNSAVGRINLARPDIAISDWGGATVGRQATRGGVGLHFNGSNASVSIGAVQTGFDSSTNAEYSIIAYVNATATASYGMIVSGNNSATDITELRMGPGGTTPQFQNRNSAGAIPDCNGSTSIIGAGPVCLIGTYNRGAAKLWQDGRLLDSQSGTNAATTFGTHSWQLGSRAVSIVEYFWSGQVMLAAVMRTALPDQEAASISKNPWLLFEPQQIILPFAVAASTAPTLVSASAINIAPTTATARLSFTR